MDKDVEVVVTQSTGLIRIVWKCACPQAHWLSVGSVGTAPVPFRHGIQIPVQPFSSVVACSAHGYHSPLAICSYPYTFLFKTNHVLIIDTKSLARSSDWCHLINHLLPIIKVVAFIPTIVPLQLFRNRVQQWLCLRFSCYNYISAFTSPLISLCLGIRSPNV